MAICGTGDHVAKKLLVAGSVDEEVIARTNTQLHSRGFDRDALIALELKCIEQESPFKRCATPVADRADRLDLSLAQGPGFVHQSADQCRLAVIHVPDHHDLDPERLHSMAPSF